jgi:hypothetical protein
MKTFLVAAALAATISSVQANPQTSKFQFEYEMFLQVDFKKREAFLQKIGKQQDAYEKAISFIRGSVHAANLIEKVSLNPKSYEINSTATLTTALNIALSGQQLKKTSEGKNTKTTFITDFYSERRGKSPALTSFFNAKSKKVEFYKAKTLISSSPYVSSLDVLNIAYNFLDKKLPDKSFSFYITDGKSIKKYTMIRSEIWNFPFNGANIQAVRYVKHTSPSDPVSLEIWYSLTNQIPMRYVIGLSDKYGATIQVDLKDFKKVP